MNIGIVCINFHCEEYISQLIKSIPDNFYYNLDIYIVENSINLTNVDSLKNEFRELNISILKPKNNLGYLGGFNYAVSYSNPKDKYDYFLLANPDIKFSETFFKILFNYRLEKDVAIIAPNILNMPSGKRANPFLKKKPNKAKIYLLLKVLSSPYLYYIYTKLSILKNYFLKKSNSENSMHIYAPHGSLIIFCKEYFASGGSTNYFNFLWGEEFFVAEECARINKKIYFEDKLNVLHFEHSTTNLLGLTSRAKMQRKSLKKIFYKYFAKNHK